MRALAVLVCGCLAAPMRGQELLWEVHSQSGVLNGSCSPWFGDFDQDGADDLLVGGLDYQFPVAWPVYRVLSGVDGSLLAEMHHPYFSAVFLGNGIGDFDGDGVPDVIVGNSGLFVEVWSLVTRARVGQFAIPPGSTGPHTSSVCTLDCNGDGWKDIVFSLPNGVIRVHDHFGALLYSIPAQALGLVPTALAAVGDLDQDGADDFLVGGIETFTGMAFGAVILLSGRDGNLLRIHWGEQPFDGLNRDLRLAGDVDGDGVTDYAAGSLDGVRGVVKVWSGATGGLIRQWTNPDPRYLIGAFLAGRDVDLDGTPDIIDFPAGYPNVPGQPAFQGRVRTLSSRDGQDLIHVESQQWTGWFANQGYADLGVHPGNPYPVFVVMDDPIIPPYNNWPRIRAYRCSPAGTRFVGAGCSSTNTIPTIGIRRVDGIPSDHSRFVLGSAPANAFAVCVAAPTSLALGAPVPLDFLGLSGCNLLVAPAILELRLTGAAGMDRGYAAFDFPGTMAATGGVEFAAQWVVLDPATLQFATTQRYEFRVQ